MLLPLPLRPAEAVLRGVSYRSQEPHHHRWIGFENVFDDRMADRIRARAAGDHRRNREASEPLDLESDFDLTESGARGAERPARLGRRDARRVCKAQEVCAWPPASHSRCEVRGARRRLLRVSEYFSCVWPWGHPGQRGLLRKATRES